MDGCQCRNKFVKPSKKIRCEVCKRKICNFCMENRPSELCSPCNFMSTFDPREENLQQLNDSNLHDVLWFLQLNQQNLWSKDEMIKQIVKTVQVGHTNMRNLMSFKWKKDEEYVFPQDTSPKATDKEKQINDCCKESLNSSLDESFDDDFQLVDVFCMSVQEMKRKLKQLGINTEKCLEKQDYIDMLTNYLTERGQSQRRKKSSSSSLRDIHVSSVEESRVRSMRSFASLQDISSLEMIPQMDVKQLKYILEKRSVNCHHILEKSELEYKVSLLYHQFSAILAASEKSAHKRRQTSVCQSKRDAFYFTGGVRSENEAGAPKQENGGAVEREREGAVAAETTLAVLPNVEDIEGQSCEQLMDILQQHHVEIEEEDSQQKWKLAFKVLQLHYQQQGMDECIICFDRPVECTLLECGHTIICLRCVVNLKLCPMCKATIRRYVKIFKS